MLITVVAGGSPIPPSLPSHLLPSALVIAADSGADRAVEVGLQPDRIIGDLDSISPDVLAAVGDTARIDRHPTDKDATDLALAVGVALDAGASALQVLGGHGGRMDHFLGNLTVLAALRVPVTWLAGNDRIELRSTSHGLRARIGQTLTVLPVGDDVVVSLTGTRWPLDGARLPFGSSRGVSNIAEAPEVGLEVHAGRVMVVFPDDVR